MLRCDVVNPKILYTCTESRKEARLTYHELVFDGVNTGCYINFDIDWVFFDTSIPLIKVFGPDPEYPVFQQNCRKLALQNKPFNVYGKKLGSFTKLEELALVTVTSLEYDVSGGGNLGNVNYFSQASLDNHNSDRVNYLSRNLDGVAKEVGIPNASVVDVHRAGAPKVMKAAEKERARLKRQEERDRIAPVRADEDLAIR
jgi:hypothetical protein